MSYIAGYNRAGSIDPQDCEVFQEYESYEHAKRAVIKWIKWEEDYAKSEEDAEELCAIAELVNLESGEFSHSCAGNYYWVKKI